jgi:hypothetical protein
VVAEVVHVQRRGRLPQRDAARQCFPCEQRLAAQVTTFQPRRVEYFEVPRLAGPHQIIEARNPGVATSMIVMGVNRDTAPSMAAAGY